MSSLKLSAELHQAMLWYEDRQAGLGAEFHDAVRAKIREIKSAPDRFPTYEGRKAKRAFRRALLDRFPYVIAFEQRSNEILIVAISHGSQRPGYWQNR